MREKLEAAWNEAHNNEKAPWEALVHAPGIDRFIRLLDAEAWLDAAMMFVPEGWRFFSADASVLGRCNLLLEGPKTKWATDEDGERCAGDDWFAQGVAPTPAEALLAAIEKARQ